MSTLPLQVYRSAVEKVPAYRAFLEQQCGAVPDVRNMDDFTRLPCMDKAGYIQAFPLEERCLDGSLHGKHVIMHSSGSTGKHTWWPSAPEVEKGYWQSVYAELDANYRISEKPTLLILGVLMGGNMSGALFAYALRAIGIETGKTTLLTAGRDEEICLEGIAEFSPRFSQTILYSYPATAKTILEKAAARGIPVERFGMRLRLLGEGYSETYRDHINRLLHYQPGSLDTINSGYGATDFRGAGRESLLCIAIKRLLHEHNLAHELLGLDAIPTICQYDPQSIHIEECEQELVMTRHNAVPLVRYRSGDTGRIIGYEEMMELLASRALDPLKLMQERGCDPGRAVRQPFVLVTGRKNGGVTFHGAKILISRVKRVLEETPYLAERLSGEFQLCKREETDLTPYLDLAVVARPDTGELDTDAIAHAFADALSARQGGIYSELLQKDRQAALPRVRLVKREDIMTPASFKIRYLG